MRENRNTRIFNTPFEVGLRAMFILNKFYPKSLNIESLIYLDYFVLHSNDLKNGPPSLHPKYPFRSAEVVIKRELLKKGIIILLSKETIEIHITENGIEYSASKVGNYVADYFDSKYSNKLKESCSWVFEQFSQASLENLRKLINDNLEKWGGEFTNESKFRDFHE